MKLDPAAHDVPHNARRRIGLEHRRCAVRLRDAEARVHQRRPTTTLSDAASTINEISTGTPQPLALYNAADGRARSDRSTKEHQLAPPALNKHERRRVAVLDGGWKNLHCLQETNQLLRRRRLLGPVSVLLLDHFKCRCDKRGVVNWIAPVRTGDLQHRTCRIITH